MRIDLHTHAVGHRYSYDGSFPASLTPRDKDDVRSLIDLALERGLDALGITDHDWALSGLWGAEYAAREQLPVRIIAGCECELYIQGHWVHLLALNLKTPLTYTPYTPATELAAQIAGQGAALVLAHPMLYDARVYPLLKTIVDGVEFRNGAAERRGYPSYTAILDEDGFQGLRLHSSDYHYPDKHCDEQWLACTDMTEAEFKRWFG